MKNNELQITFVNHNDKDTYSFFKKWHEDIKELNNNSSRPINLYIYKIKGLERFLPFWLIKLIKKPLIYENCEIKNIEIKNGK
jgi:hypothetical protein